MATCFGCKKEIAGVAHAKLGKRFCSHCWEHGRSEAAEHNLKLE